MLIATTADWLVGLLVLAIGVLLPAAAVARANRLFSRKGAKRAS